MLYNILLLSDKEDGCKRELNCQNYLEKNTIDEDISYYK